MRLRTVLTIAVIAACLRPASGAVLNAPLQLADARLQTPAQVFVRDDRAAAETDPALGSHGAGVRAPRPDDDPSLPLYTAAGDPLSFTLEKWRAAAGAVVVAPDDANPAGDSVTLAMHHLIAFGHYSVFVRSDDGGTTHFAPLDGSGLTNNFDARADGNATVTVASPDHLASGTWIVTIYHSDAQDHGNSPGELALDAHEQLLVKLP